MKMNQLMAALIVIIGIYHIVGVGSVTYATPLCTPAQMIRRGGDTMKRITLLEKTVELLVHLLAVKRNKKYIKKIDKAFFGSGFRIKRTVRIEELIKEISYNTSNSLLPICVPRYDIGNKK